MEYILVIILSAAFTLGYFYFKKNSVSSIKPQAVKKDELIENYKLELLELLNKKYTEARKTTSKIPFKRSMTSFINQVNVLDKTICT